LSELIRPRPQARVEAFVKAQTDPLISVLTIYEITYGAERAPDAARRAKLVAWVAAIQSRFAGRIVAIDAAIAEQAGRLRAAAEEQGTAADPIDSLIAACALSHSASIATRNVRDFAAFGVSITDPWAA
jgi:predicted nucleic acid-binding protein